MSQKRIAYQNWIVDLGREPGKPAKDTTEQPSIDRSQSLIQAVRAAIKKLSSDEREFIHLYYYRGMSCSQISEQSYRSQYRLESLHRTALKKLRPLLAGFVAERYNIIVEPATDCPICLSPFRPEIDRILARRDRRDTYRPVIGTLQERFGVSIVSPHIIIGHEKYHL